MRQTMFRFSDLSQLRLRIFWRVIAALLGALFAAGGLAMPAAAQEEEVPYWASLRTERANMRVGPGGSYRITWVYQRSGLPLKVVRKTSGWRLVEDPEGERGWIVARFLSRERSVIVTGDSPAAIRAEPREDSALLWQAEPGVSGMLGDCRGGWCRIAVEDREGWMREDRMWGDGEP